MDNMDFYEAKSYACLFTNYQIDASVGKFKNIRYNSPLINSPLCALPPCGNQQGKRVGRLQNFSTPLSFCVDVLRMIERKQLLNKTLTFLLEALPEYRVTLLSTFDDQLCFPSREESEAQLLTRTLFIHKYVRQSCTVK